VRLRGTALGYLIIGAISTVEGGLGVLLTPYLHVNGFPVTAIGGFIALYAVATLLSRLPGGRWYRPGWIRPLLVASLLLQAVSNLAFPLFTDALPLAIARLVTGFAYGLGTTLNLAQFLDSLPPDRPKDRATALYSAMIAFGFAVGNVTGGLLADYFGYWAGFAGTSAYAVVAAVAEEPAVVRPRAGTGGGARGFVAALGEPVLLVVLLEVLFFNFLFAMYYVLVPLQLLAVGAALGHLGIIRGLFSGSQVVSRGGAGWLTTRFGHQRVSGWALVAQVVALALVPATPHLLLLTVLAVGYGVARGAMAMSNTLGLAVASDRSTLGRGAASGVYNAASDVGGLVGPLLAGTAADAVGIGNALILLPLGVLVVWGVAICLNGQRSRPAPRPAD
jgi:MFS transporter, DHA1 family, multidrug resistance protein